MEICFFKHPSNTTDDDNVGFISNKIQSQNEHLNLFEDYLFELNRNIKFNREKINFRKIRWKYYDLQITFLLLLTRQTILMKRQGRTTTDYYMTIFQEPINN